MVKRQYGLAIGKSETDVKCHKKLDNRLKDIKESRSTFEIFTQELANMFSKLKLEDEDEYLAHLHTLWNSLTTMRLERQLVIQHSNNEASLGRIDAENQWVAETFRTLIDVLFERILHGPEHMMLASFQYLMEGIKIECSIRLNKESISAPFPLRYVDSIVKCCLRTSSHLFCCLVEKFVDDYMKIYKDIRYYFMISLHTVMEELLSCSETSSVQDSGSNMSQISRHIFLFLQSFPTPQEIKDDPEFSTARFFSVVNKENGKVNNWKAYKIAYVGCWLRYLEMAGERIQLSFDLYKEILTLLPTHVLPFLENPLLISKFFFDAFYHHDTAVAVESLSGLFYLLVKSRLAEPQLLDSTRKKFYSQLLSLLHPRIFSLPIRARFLRLLHAALRSSNLPLSTRAVFIKKMVSISLLTSPGASLWLLAVALRLMQRGGLATMKYLISRNITTQAIEAEDPLVSGSTPDDPCHPFESLHDALDFTKRRSGWENDDVDVSVDESLNQKDLLHSFSLWELRFAALHWNPCISAVAELFDENMFKANAKKINADQLLNASTSEMLFYHMKPLIKATPGSSSLFVPINVDNLCHDNSQEGSLNLIRAGSAC